MQHRTTCSLKQCRIKKGKETRSFPTRNPFVLYPFLGYWLSERYKLIESFAGVVGGDEHLCLFFCFRELFPSQYRGIARLGKLHELADEDFLVGRGRDVVQYLSLVGTDNAHILRCTVICNLIIKVMGMNVISWLLIENRIYLTIRWTTKKRASFFLFLYSAMSQRTLKLIVQR